MISRYLELLNATLALSLILLILITSRDFKKEFLRKDKKTQTTIVFLGLGIVVLSVKELYKYWLFDSAADPVTAELIETLSFVLITAAFFSLLRLKEFTHLK